MVLLMGIAAIAIDYGLGTNERRLDQNGADTAVMAGAVEYATGGQAQGIVDQILLFVDNNVRPVGNAEWAACQDPDHLSLPLTDPLLSYVTPQTECISFGGDRLRVSLPDQVIDTTFARVIGQDSLTLSAAAEALGLNFPGGGSAPPFVALNGSSAGDQVCLRTSSSGPQIPPQIEGNGPSVPAAPGTDPDPCDETVYDPSSQFFGTLDPLVYYNNATNAVTCKSNLIALSIAQGIDHSLGSFQPDYVVGASNPLGTDVVEDQCNGSIAFGVNTMALNTGLSAAQLRCGMLSSQGGVCSSSVPPGPAGGNSVDARLQSGPYTQSSYRFVGEAMDNKAIWEFLPDYASNGLSWPSACESIYDNQSDPTWDYFDKKEEMLACLSDWNDAAHDDLFTSSLLSTPRFAWIPLLAESNLSTQPSVCPVSGGSKCVHFNSFTPVYLQTLYTLITGGGGAGACDPGGPGQRWGRHEAGETTDCGKSNQNLDRLGSIILDCGMLPDDICAAGPGGPGGDPFPELELVK